MSTLSTRLPNLADKGATMISRRSRWRDTYKVHPAADVFPMMSDDELAKLGEDIKTNGLIEPITVAGDRTLLDGRNRLEAMERAGVEKAGGWWHEAVYQDDPVAYVISRNIRRRHLTKQQQAELIVAAHKAAAEASRQVGEVPKRYVKGKAGSEKDAVKAKAVETAKEHGVSKRTVERAIAKAEGKKPKPKAKPKGVVEDEQWNALVKEGREIVSRLKAGAVEEPSRRELLLEAIQASKTFAETSLVVTSSDLDDEIVKAVGVTAKAWVNAWGALLKKGGATLPQDGRNEVPVDDPTPTNDDFDLGDIPACLDRRRQP